MRPTMADRRVIIKSFAKAYQSGSRGRRSALLDEVVQVTGYHRKYAAWLLRTHGRKTDLGSGVVVVADVAAGVSPGAAAKPKRRRRSVYGQDVREALVVVWRMLDCICGKRLVWAMRDLLPELVAHGSLRVSSAVLGKLMRISAATADRLLSAERKRVASVRRRRLTRPGSLLKRQIPIRTFGDWSDAVMGYMEADLVAHDGGNPSGDYCHTLDMVDVRTGWTEQVAVLNRAQRWVFEALKEVRGRLPFPLLGLDSDNGSEFINAHLKRWCDAERIVFTRSRPYRKNDSCHVEQKNWSVVRRYVGYRRYEGSEDLAVLNALYAVLRLYTNFFLPSMRLREKVRDGARVLRRYDRPRTPYQRVLDDPEVSDECKAALRRMRASLNPAHLQARIEEIQDQLMDRTYRRPANRPPCRAGFTNTSGHGGSPPRRSPKLAGLAPDTTDR